jgi:Uma2 family endonuclease
VTPHRGHHVVAARARLELERRVEREDLEVMLVGAVAPGNTNQDSGVEERPRRGPRTGRERLKDDGDAITNPTLLVEVLSETTGASDRGDEWAHDQHIESLQEYVLVSQREPRVEVFRRAERGCTYEAFGAGRSLRCGRST